MNDIRGALHESDDLLRAKINADTSTINWLELQRHFAAGRVIVVSALADLVEVALQLSRDNQQQVQSWINEGLVAGVSETQAMQWYEQKVTLWAVVVAPWVLVQERSQDI